MAQEEVVFHRENCDNISTSTCLFQGTHPGSVVYQWYVSGDVDPDMKREVLSKHGRYIAVRARLGPILSNMLSRQHHINDIPRLKFSCAAHFHLNGTAAVETATRLVSLTRFSSLRQYEVSFPSSSKISQVRVYEGQGLRLCCCYDPNGDLHRKVGWQLPLEFKPLTRDRSRPPIVNEASGELTIPAGVLRQRAFDGIAIPCRFGDEHRTVRISILRKFNKNRWIMLCTAISSDNHNGLCETRPTDIPHRERER